MEGEDGWSWLPCAYSTRMEKYTQGTPDADDCAAMLDELFNDITAISSKKKKDL